MKHSGNMTVEEMQRRIKEEDRRRDFVRMNSQVVTDEGLWGYVSA
jgi:hypothetical protein